ncbi:unnamed protein product, partial [marine sediment metagenome]
DIDNTGPRCYLIFSGGKDDDIVAGNIEEDRRLPLANTNKL